MIILTKLPFAENALEPFISAETIRYHYGKHHTAYVNKLNEMIVGTEFENMSLSAIIKSSEGAIFNNAAQVFNHSFYWQSLSASKSFPGGKLLEKINNDFGSVDRLKEEFMKAGTTLFGSGWVWLVKDANGQLMLKQTSNAQMPLNAKLLPLLVCDVWEHAYYIDYRNARQQYLEKFWDHIHWDFARKRFEKSDKDSHDAFSQMIDELQDPDSATS
jgi:Fe-Mn family superoxide dismutase